MKSEDRVKGYKKGTKDWEAEYNMLLDDGVTCVDCLHSRRCFGIGYSEPGRDRCDFYPSKFSAKEPVNTAAEKQCPMCGAYTGEKHHDKCTLGNGPVRR